MQNLGTFKIHPDLQTDIIFGTEVVEGTQISVPFGHLSHPPTFSLSYTGAFLAAAHSASKLLPNIIDPYHLSEEYYRTEKMI